MVRDASGGPVSGARVAVEAPAKGLHRETKSDDEGRFTLPELPPGRYSAVVESEGFATFRVEALDLEVGQTRRFDVTLEVAAVSETIEAVAEAPTLTTAGSSVVDGVVDQEQIEQLPLNGRNYLELAFLVPGNVPAPNFDPTKTNSVVVASAGQFGRGGMITIDGADNNDDVVGGPLQNLPQDAVQEFQIATNRYTAENGRSAASAINVVTRSGTDRLRGTASLFLRDSELQALPATYDGSQGTPPFDRQQYSFSLGGPLRTGIAHWFAAVEYRDQDGGILVGERDVASRTIRRSFAEAPLTDLLGVARFDWSPDDRDHLTFRLAAEDADDTAASTLERSIGSASQRQDSSSRYVSLLADWSRTLSGSTVNTFAVSYSRFRNSIVPVAPNTPQLTFPSLQDGASFRVPQATDQDRIELRDDLAIVRDEHSLKFGADVQLIDGAFDLGVFQAGRIELVQDFADFDHNGDGVIDDRDLLFSVTLRSASPIATC